MREAVVLVNGAILYLDQISDMEVLDPYTTDIVFDDNGKVVSFKKDGVDYMDLYTDYGLNDEGERIWIFKGFYDERIFWQEDVVTSDGQSRIPSVWKYDRNLFAAKENGLQTYGDITDPYLTSFLADGIEPGTKVWMVTKIMKFESEDFHEIVIKRVSFDYPDLDRYMLESENIHENIDSFPNYNDGYPLLRITVSNPLYHKYRYHMWIREFPTDGPSRTFTPNDEELLDEIVHLFYQLDELGYAAYLSYHDLEQVFINHFDIINDTEYTIISQIKFEKYFTREYFALLRLRLIELKYRFKNLSDSDYGDKTEAIVGVISLFNHFELSRLTFDYKMELIDDMVGGNFWISGRWSLSESETNLSEEEAIVKIVRSVYREYEYGVPNYDEINEFMDIMNDRPKFDEDGGKCYYQILYESIHDTLFFSDTGKSARGQFVTAIYQYWNHSKYNPYHELPEIADVALDHFTYTPYTGYWELVPPDYSDGEVEEIEFDYSAAPMLIGYESEKELFWYTDNFEFHFSYKNSVIPYSNCISSWMDDEWDDDEHELWFHGKYNIFQPVGLMETDALDTIVKMPVSQVMGDEVPDNPDDFKQNSIPIFYLKYVDDLGDYSDAKAGFGTALDVVLTFSGIGNITKLRHILKISALRKYLTESLDDEARDALKSLMVKSIGSLVIGSAESVIGLASMVFHLFTVGCDSYVDPEVGVPEEGEEGYDDYEWCLEMDKLLFRMEMMILAGDILARSAFKRALRKFRQKIPSGPQFDGLRDLVISLDEDTFKFLNFLDALEDTHPNLRAILDTFPSENKRMDFWVHFGKKSKYLDEFEADLIDPDRVGMSLVDAWLEIQYLFFRRKKMKFLKSYRRIMEDSDLQEHVHYGTVRLTNDDPLITGVEFTGVHNPHILVPFPPSSGNISWKGSPVTDPKDIGYKQGKVVRNMHDKIDPVTGEPWKVIHSDPPNHLKVKKHKTVTWPETYSTQRINEEMANALATLDPQKYTIFTNAIGEKTYIYEVNATDGHPLEILFFGGEYRSSELVSIYPQYF